MDAPRRNSLLRSESVRTSETDGRTTVACDYNCMSQSKARGWVENVRSEAFTATECSEVSRAINRVRMEL
jgi:hypothetical protein